MSLTTIVEKKQALASDAERGALLALNASRETVLPSVKYSAAASSFSEQYLERPVISGDYSMAISPTACTWRGVPTIDDW